MKRFTILPILMLTLWSGCSKSGGGVKLHTDTDSVAYVIGLNVGANLLKMDSTLNAAAVCKGIADYFAGRQSMTMEEAQTFYLRYVNYAVPEKIREQERRFLDDVTSGQGFKSSESVRRYARRRPQTDDRLRHGPHRRSHQGVAARRRGDLLLLRAWRYVAHAP